MTDPEEIEPSENALPAEALRYPEFDLGDGDGDGDGDDVAADGTIDATRDLDWEEMETWLRDLADGLGSHDVAFEGENRRATFGVAPAGVDVSFEPDADHRGTVEVTFRLNARVMDVADADLPKVGARGGRGFIPLAMLTEGDDRTYHCYNWIDDPSDGTDGGTDAGGDPAGDDSESAE